MLRAEKVVELYGPDDRVGEQLDHLIGQTVYYQKQRGEGMSSLRALMEASSCRKGRLVDITRKGYMIKRGRGNTVFKVAWVGIIETTYWELV